MNRMLGRAFRKRLCPYGCCGSDLRQRAGSRYVSNLRAKDKRSWRKEVDNLR